MDTKQPEPVWKKSWRVDCGQSFAFIAGMLGYSSFVGAPDLDPLELERKCSQVDKVFGDPDVQAHMVADTKDFVESLEPFLRHSMMFPEVTKRFLTHSQAVSGHPLVLNMFQNVIVHSGLCYNNAAPESINMLIAKIQHHPSSWSAKTLHDLVRYDKAEHTRRILDVMPQERLEEWMLKLPRTVRKRGNQSLVLVRQAIQSHNTKQMLTQAVEPLASPRAKSFKL